MRIILNRDDIEEAIHAYVKDKFFPYGDKRELSIVQGTKATATITLKQDEKLPGFDEECDESDLVETTEPERDAQVSASNPLGVNI